MHTAPGGSSHADSPCRFTYQWSFPSCKWGWKEGVVCERVKTGGGDNTSAVATPQGCLTHSLPPPLLWLCLRHWWVLCHWLVVLLHWLWVLLCLWLHGGAVLHLHARVVLLAGHVVGWGRVVVRCTANHCSCSCSPSHCSSKHCPAPSHAPPSPHLRPPLAAAKAQRGHSEDSSNDSKGHSQAASHAAPPTR